MEEEQKVKVINFSRPISLWTTGWVFTLGYLDVWNQAEEGWRLIEVLATLVVWPWLLGHNLGGW